MYMYLGVLYESKRFFAIDYEWSHFVLSRGKESVNWNTKISMVPDMACIYADVNIKIVILYNECPWIIKIKI